MMKQKEEPGFGVAMALICQPHTSYVSQARERETCVFLVLYFLGFSQVSIRLGFCKPNTNK